MTAEISIGPLLSTRERITKTRRKHIPRRDYNQDPESILSVYTANISAVQRSRLAIASGIASAELIFRTPRMAEITRNVFR